MFSAKQHTIYGKNQIMEAVCQYRFPTILQIESQAPAKFQEMIRDVFPRYEERKEALPPKALPQPGAPMPPQQTVTNYAFSTLDGAWRINLTQGFIALTSTNYKSWEEFAKMLDKPLASFLDIYKPACFDRIGLRYVNAVSRKQLDLEGTPWRDLITERYLGCLAEQSVAEQSFSRCTQDLDMAIPGGCRMKMHAGPGIVRRAGQPEDQESKFILDIDVSMGNQLPIHLAAGALSTLHTQAWNVFRGAITDTLHDAMEPED